MSKISYNLYIFIIIFHHIFKNIKLYCKTVRLVIISKLFPNIQCVYLSLEHAKHCSKRVHLNSYPAELC